MFYEVTVIDGILHKRTSPTGEWLALNKEHLTQHIARREKQLARVIASARDQHGRLRDLSENFNAVFRLYNRQTTHVSSLEHANVDKDARIAALERELAEARERIAAVAGDTGRWAHTRGEAEVCREIAAAIRLTPPALDPEESDDWIGATVREVD
jgi:hypothetical protein